MSDVNVAVRENRRKINIVGQRFGLLSVVKEADRVIKDGKMITRQWECLCDCGVTVVVRQMALITGNTNSCGCAKRQRFRLLVTKHGQSKHPSYGTWKRMIQRCHNPNNPNYKDYGARGIVVCDRWRHSFPAFLSDTGHLYQPGLTIERINNDGNYEPDNVRWATRTEQANNQRSNHLISMDEHVQTISQWAHEYGVSPRLVYKRLRRGWSLKKSLTVISQRQIPS